jgi:4-amino-4-deoxy-L-arabinose transferase-like glycosyltransferase
LVAGFLLVAYGLLRAATHPGWQDTEGYLGHGLYVHEHGGWIGWLRQSFAGTFPISERHPLYLVLIAPFAARAASYFFAAKLMNVLFGALVLISVLWMTRRRYGAGPSLLAGSLYAVSQSLVIASSHVNNEPLFVLTMLWAWWWLTSGEAPWRWAVGGVCAGLAWLTKSPAVLLVVAVGLASLWSTRGRVLRQPALWSFLLALVCTTSPWLVNNWRAYGTPLYEGVNTHIMWLDRWSQLGDPASVMYRDPYGIKTIAHNALPDARAYLATHGLGTIVRRLAGGYAQELIVVARDALRPAAALPRLLGYGWGWALLALGLFGWWRLGPGFERRVVGFWALAFLTFFGWDAPLFPDVRYLAPLVPVFVGYAGVVLWRMLLSRYSARRAAQVALAASLAVVAAPALWIAGYGGLTAPQPRMNLSPAYERLVGWVKDTLPQGGAMLVGPTMEFYGGWWLLSAPVQIYQPPLVATQEAFLEYLDARGITTLVIHPENLQGLEDRLKLALAPHWYVSQDGAIEERTPLPGWQRVFADPGTPSRFLIYQPLEVTDGR